MVNQKKIYAMEFTVIVLLWSLAVISPLLFSTSTSRNWAAIHLMWAECGVIFVLYLINRFLLMPTLFFSRRYAAYACSLILLFALFSLFILYFDGVNEILSLFGYEMMEFGGTHVIASGPTMGEGFGHHPHHTPAMPPMASPPIGSGVIPPRIGVIIISCIVVALDVGLSIAFKWVISEQKQAEQKRERVAVQLSNLQSQVSPHFFMNTLNNIHALVEIEPKRAQKTIIELSELMDYLLYETSNEELVSLKREIEFITSYVNLMRLRYPKRVRIDLVSDSEIPQVKIPPLLPLNFIENAFKYGVDYNEDSFIKITFSFTPTHIEMEALNSNHASKVKSHRHGLGIANSRKRLKLLYGDQFSLKIKETEAVYCVNLKIPIV